MESLVSNAANFSPQYILNLGQLDILSRFDSFGDIPGHGEIVLDRKVLWTLKSNLVLFWMSFAVLDKIYTRGKWSEMPMDIIRQLSVTFPDCSESSVLDAATVVTAMSYNFPTGEKQHGLLITFFVEQYEKILFRGVYFVCNFYRSSAKYFLFLECRSTEFLHIFSGLLSFLSLSTHQHQHFIKLFRSVMLVSGFASWWYRYYCCGLHTFPANQYFQDSKFMTCLRFQNIYSHVFLSFFYLIPKRFNKACA